MKHIEVTALEVPSGMEFAYSSYPKDGFYLIQNGATLVVRSGGVAMFINNGLALISEKEEVEVKSQSQGTVSESTLLRVIAVMRDTNLVNKFDL